MIWRPKITDQWTLWPPIPVTLATLSMEAAPGLVGVEGDGVDRIQLVKVCLCVLRKQTNKFYTVIECPPLPTITNGTISYSLDVTPDHDLGTEATYTCEVGFYLEGNEARVCMDDDGMDAIGVWSGQEPSCVRKFSNCSVCFVFCYRTFATMLVYCNAYIRIVLCT